MLFVLNWVTIDGSFGDPHQARKALEAMYGKPCDCKGGVMNGRALLIGEIWSPNKAYAQVEFGDTWAYRALQPSGSTPSLEWHCVTKPKMIPYVNGCPVPCPCDTYQQVVHSSCYRVVQQCTGKDNITYFTAILNQVREEMRIDDCFHSVPTGVHGS